MLPRLAGLEVRPSHVALNLLGGVLLVLWRSALGTWCEASSPGNGLQCINGCLAVVELVCITRTGYDYRVLSAVVL